MAVLLWSLVWLSVLSSWYFVAYTRWCGGSLAVLALGALLLGQPLAASLLAICALFALLTTRWWVTTVSGSLLLLDAMVELVKQALAAPVVWLVLGALLIGSINLITMRFWPKWRLKKLAMPRWAPPARPQAAGTLKDGTPYLINVRYATTAQSTLDIYYPPVANGQTAILVHGGGFLWGNLPKPESLQKDGPGTYQHQLLRHGYVVVQVDYARTPDAPHPVALQQLCTAVSYLQTHAASLHLSLAQVLFGGTSAGASLVGQFINAQCDSQWASTCHLPQVLQPKQLTGVIFASGLLDISQFGVTHAIKTDYLFTQMGRIYAGVNDLQHARQVRAMDVIPHVNAAWPPVFLSDGNHGTFFEQAKAMAARLQQLQVPCTLVWFPKSEARLGHTFEKGASLQAQTVRTQLDAWLDAKK